MFVVSKLFWMAVDPANLLAGSVVAGALLLAAGRARIGRALVDAAAVATVLIMALPLGTWALRPLEGRFPPPAALPARVDGIVTLGGAVDQVVTAARGQVALVDAAERLTAFVALARRYPDARLLYTGGSGRLTHREHRETTPARMLLADLGLDPARVVFEGESRNTYENARLSQALVSPRPGETWLLVTSAAHMPRAVGIFRRAGWPVVPYPVDFRTTGGLDWPGSPLVAERLLMLSQAAREWAGLLAYRAMGRTDELFPGP
jgi:uncharacterized SAM-binding protein YcdF (DUF218 family)